MEELPVNNVRSSEGVAVGIRGRRKFTASVRSYHELRDCYGVVETQIAKVVRTVSWAQRALTLDMKEMKAWDKDMFVVD